MAVTFQFVSAFTCERVLVERDGIVSAIRIVDIFFIPEERPPVDAVVVFWAVVSMKASPVPSEEIRVGVTLIRSNGDRERLPAPPNQPYKAPIYDGDPSIPTGINFCVEVNIIPKNIGTCFLEIDIDGEPQIRIPFTLRHPRKEAQKS